MFMTFVLCLLEYMATMIIKNVRRVTLSSLVRLALGAVAALVLAGHGSGRSDLQAAANPVSVENALPGHADWDVVGAGDPDIQGFATDISVNTGGDIVFKIASTGNYRVDIYRLGYYGGLGARKVDAIPALPAQTQPACLSEATTGLVDCGNWAVSASWHAVDPVSGLDATSGVYVAKLNRLAADNITVAGTSHIVFIVRDDARKAAVLVQTSDTTWQAYNTYGGTSLYCAPAGVGLTNLGSAYSTPACPNRAAKASYNRPFDTRGPQHSRSFLFSAEYPMLRFLEANGYDVKYWAGVDTDRRGADLVDIALKPNVFLSVGHDEYWSGDQRTRIESARSAGLNLAFFSGNEMFWKTRYETDVNGAQYRTLVSYKETLAAAKIDPALDGAGQPIWTGSWRDPRFSPPADGGRPENGVTGTMWTVNQGSTAITVPAAMASLRLWQNTRVADLTEGVATLPFGTLGYEWNEDLDNGSRPQGLIHLSSTTVNGVEKIIDYGATTGIGTSTHNLTLYRHPLGALVFSAGTIQWSWGLDQSHDGGTAPPDQAMQQATLNLLADMGAQPATLQESTDPDFDLVAPAPSTDTVAPTSQVTSPAAGAQVSSGSHVTIEGTATDTGGGAAAGVEVSVDGGATWRSAQGASNWTFDWVPGTVGAVTIRSRAIDDSGNVQIPTGGVAVSVVAGRCPCTQLFATNVIPAVASANDHNAIEVGVKFTSDINGFIAGIRFYKGAANIGTHIGNLWSLNGTRLATAEFVDETASGWQQVNFSAPVAITAHTVYVASYHTNVGSYASENGFFGTVGIDSPPLRAPAAAPASGNGVYRYGGSAFPSNTFNGTNYFVDVVFAETVVDSSQLVISNINASAIDGSNAVVSWKTSKPATSGIDYSTDQTFPPPPLTGTVEDGAFVTQHRLTLTGLIPNSTYYFMVFAVDQDGNFALEMAPSFTVPGPTLHDTATIDFGAGTAAGTYVSHTADGEVILAPMAGSEFAGPGLPPGWVEVTWVPEGYSNIEDGVLVVQGARVATCAVDVPGACSETQSATDVANLHAPTHSLEFAAKFSMLSGDAFQNAGLGQTFFDSGEPWAMFSTFTGGQLYARSNPGGPTVDSPLGTAMLGSFHRYRVDWKADGVDYYIDGALVASHAVTITRPMRAIAASDFDADGGTVFVDWMRLSPYAIAGTFESRIFDALSAVNWKTIQWKSMVPAGTSLAISVRTGNTSTPDATWSAFLPMAAPGGLSATGRYIQYRATLTTTDPTQTPELRDIILSTSLAPVPQSKNVAVNQDTSRTFPATGPGSLTEGAIDDTPIAQLRVVGVTAPTHGTATLNADGSVRYTPALGFNGNDSFTYTLSDGLLTGTGTVNAEVGDTTVVNSDPAAVNDSATIAEDSGANAIDVLANDNDGVDEGETLVVTAATQGTHGTTTFTATGVSYAPATDYNGADSFTYTISDGNGGTATATVSVTVINANDDPTANDDIATVAEDSGATVISVLANDNDGVDAGETLTVTAASQGAHGATTFTATGVSYAPAASYNGPDSFTYTIGDGNGGIATATVAVTVTAVNDVPSFTKGGDQVQVGTPVAKTVPNWATSISAGPANEASQTLNFIVTAVNTGLFAVQPAVSPGGTLTYTPFSTAAGSTVVSVQLRDDGGIANNGKDTSAAQTFNISLSKAPTTTTVVSSSNPSLFGVPITLTAAVTSPAGTPTGVVSFLDGAATIACGAGSVLVAPTATCKTSLLAVGTRSIKAIYGGSDAFLASTSAAISQTISASASLKVSFQVHAMQDGTKAPKVKTIPVPNALVRVFSTANTCVGNIFSAINPKKWGIIFDGSDGPGGVDGCAPVAVGTYQATGTTDVNGMATIIVPPLPANWTTQYLVIARATNFDYVKTVATPDPLYSNYPVISLVAGQIKTVPLAMIATFNGKVVPGAQAEFFGSYLNIVQPEYMDWTEETEQYPFVMVAQGDWDVSTSIAPPSGFVPDESSQAVMVADTVTAVQFTLTDVGSDWTETGVTHVINHNGIRKVETGSIKMFNKLRTRAKPDYTTVLPDSSNNVIDVLPNDSVADTKTLAITALTPAEHGSASIDATGLRVVYTPDAGFVGSDRFTYTIQDNLGAESTTTVQVRVNTKASVALNDARVVEGHAGTSAALFTATLSFPLDGLVEVDFTTEDNGTAFAGIDYVATTGTLVFAPGETTKTISVPVIGNTSYHGSRSFRVRLWRVINAALMGGIGVGEIIDDDPKPSFTISGASVVEGTGGVTPVTVTVTLVGETALQAHVNYSTANGSAVVDSDYHVVSDTLTFAPGETVKTFVVGVLGDTVTEPTETFQVRLTYPAGATLATPNATVSIIDDDATAWLTTTMADFNKGTIDAGAYVSQTNNGEIILAPTLGSEFPGQYLPAAWASAELAAGGSAGLSTNSLSIDGASVIGGTTTYGRGRSLEFNGRFSGAAGQNVGFTTEGMLQAPYAVFGTKVGGTLLARSVIGGTTLETPLTGATNLTAAHKFRIDWNVNTVVYWIDDKKVATHTIALSDPMKPTALDLTVGDGALTISWMRMTPYASSGTYTSAVFDAGSAATLISASWTATTPAGTSVVIQYRTGDTATPDSSWTEFKTVPTSGAVLSGPSSRYLQFAVAEGTSNPNVTPIVKDVTLTLQR
jgi:hypothetical protein